MDPVKRNEYYYFYAGYYDNKFVRVWDHYMTLAHFAIGFFLGLINNYPLLQTISILIILVLLLIITGVLRPWKFSILNATEIIS